MMESPPEDPQMMESPSEEPQIIESPAEAVQMIEDSATLEDPQMIESPTEEPQMMESPVDAVQIIDDPQMMDEPQMIESPAEEPQMIDCPAGPSVTRNASRAFGSFRPSSTPAITSLPRSVCAALTVASFTRPSVIRADAHTFVSPAPAPMRPAAGMNELPSSSAARSSIGVRLDRRSRSNAAAPRTTPAAMLVPDNCMTAWDPAPAT